MADLENQQEEEWVPPTEGELKIIEARRERQDKISKIMGQYLLKGYRMLSSTCPKCSTILMRTRPANGTTADGIDYCIACSELDSDISKDDPVLDSTAARSQVLEGQVRESQSQEQVELFNGKTSMSRMASGDGSMAVDSAADDGRHFMNSVPTEARPSNPEGAVSNAMSMRMGRPDTGSTQIESCTALGCLRKCDPPRVSSDEAGSRARCAMMVICPSAKVKDQTSQASEQLAGQQNSTASPVSTSSHHHHHHHHVHQSDACPIHNVAHYSCSMAQKPQNLNLKRSFCSIEHVRIRDSLAAVFDKMAWASDQLKKSKEVEQSRQLCSLISCCAEAVSALKAASSLSAEKSEDKP